MRKTSMFNSAILVLLLFGIVVSNASAGNLGLSSFRSNNSSNPVDGLGEAKNPMMDVVGFVIGLFAVSIIINAFGSGSTSNIGTAFHQISLRSKGIYGIIIGVGVVFLVAISLIASFYFYNHYI